MKLILAILLLFSQFAFSQIDASRSETKNSGAIFSRGKVSSGNNTLGIPNRTKVENIFKEPEKGINFKPK